MYAFKSLHCVYVSLHEFLKQYTNANIQKKKKSFNMLIHDQKRNLILLQIKQQQRIPITQRIIKVGKPFVRMVIFFNQALRREIII